MQRRMKQENKIFSDTFARAHKSEIRKYLIISNGRTFSML